MIQKANFRYDINALRAIAVIGVILFHFKIPFFNGGFSGVDIFFVISGYLMTRIVINGLSNNKFSLLEFYGKRVQRIIPALLFVILVLLVVNFFIFIPNDYQLIAKNAFSSLLFFSNISYYQSNYFDASSDTNMWLHTWSLSVEWQFYLILPIILIQLTKYVKSDSLTFLILFVLTTIGIFIVTIVITNLRPNASFYLLPTRSWEMLVGGIAFLIEDRIKNLRLEKFAWVGYVMLLSGIVLLNNQLSWPGISTLIPVFGTFIIIVSNSNNLKILRLPAVQYLGKISYSLYLWHWPVYVIANYLGFSESLPLAFSLILISGCLATVSFYYIESIKFKGSQSVLIYTLVLAMLSYLLSVEQTNGILFKKETLDISNYNKNHKQEQKLQFNSGTCFVSSEGNGLVSFDKTNCLSIKADKKNILLIGDSHSAHLSQSLRDQLKEFDINMIQASASGCLPIIKKNGADRCQEIIDYIYLDYLPKNSNNIHGVIISADWILNNSSEADLLVNIAETLKYLEHLKIKAVIIGQSETYTIPFSSIAAREYQDEKNIHSKFLNIKSFQQNELLKKHFSNSYIDIFNIQDISKLSLDNVPYMFDQNHFTKYGADEIAKRLKINTIFQNFIN